MLTKQDIQDRVDEIAALAKEGDDEAAHSCEDKLYLDFIRYVQEYAPEPYSDMASKVMESRHLDFARWCA